MNSLNLKSLLTLEGIEQITKIYKDSEVISLSEVVEEVVENTSFIEYDMTLTTALDGTREATNIGTSGVNGLANTGRAYSFDSSLSQAVPTADLTGATHTIYTFNGTTVYQASVLDLTTTLPTGAYSNIIYLSQALTTIQQEAYTNNPEEFLSYDSNRNRYSNVLNATELANVVAHFPCTDTDGNLRDNANYSLGMEQVINVNFENGLNGYLTLNATNVGDRAFINASSGSGYVRCETTLSTSVYQFIEVDLEVLSGEVNIESWGGSLYKTISAPFNGTIKLQVIINGSEQKIVIGRKPGSTPQFYVDNWSIKEISGIYPITNHVAESLETGLSYGLQTCKLDLVDEAIEGLSDGFRFYGDGYIDTFFTPLSSEDFTIHLGIKDFETTDKNQLILANELSGIRCYKATNHGFYVYYANSNIYVGGAYNKTDFLLSLVHHSSGLIEIYINGNLTNSKTEEMTSLLSLILGEDSTCKVDKFKTETNTINASEVLAVYNEYIKR